MLSPVPFNHVFMMYAFYDSVFFFRRIVFASIRLRLCYGLDDRGSIPGRGLGILLFATASRPALDPTQPPI